MILELYTWTEDKDTLLDGLVLYNFGSFQEDRNGETVFVPGPEIQISHIGPITKILGYDEENNPITETVSGHHANLRCFGDLAKWFIEGKEQYDEEGKLKSIFERTKILDVIKDLEFKEMVNEGVPSGYIGPNGVLLIDPKIVSTPYNVWA